MTFVPCHLGTWADRRTPSTLATAALHEIGSTAGSSLHVERDREQPVADRIPFRQDFGTTSRHLPSPYGKRTKVITGGAVLVVDSVTALRPTRELPPGSTTCVETSSSSRRCLSSSSSSYTMPTAQSILLLGYSCIVENDEPNQYEEELFIIGAAAAYETIVRLCFSSITSSSFFYVAPVVVLVLVVYLPRQPQIVAAFRLQSQTASCRRVLLLLKLSG